MAERGTTVVEGGRRPTYGEALGITKSVSATTVAGVSQQRTVVTSMTEGVVSLRYAPRPPKASEPVDTAS